MCLDNYVTCEQCEQFRSQIYKQDSEQNIILTRLNTQVDIQTKLSWAILSVLLAQLVSNIIMQ